jgi:hypothetical protein
VFPWPGNSAPVFPDRTAGLSSDRLPASSAQLQHQRLLAGADTFPFAVLLVVILVKKR